VTALFQRAHAGKAGAKAGKARVQPAIGRGEQRDQRAALRIMAIKRGQHHIGADAHAAHPVGIGGGAAVGIAGEALHKGELARFHAGKGGGLGHGGADLAHGAGGLAGAVGDGFARAGIIGQVAHMGLHHLFDEILRFCRSAATPSTFLR
jgi:hypothetical protein